MGQGFWTDERVEALLKLWGEGYSAAQIGAKLKASRNSVLGKLFRLKTPEPMHKKAIVRNRVYARQPAEITRANARARQQRYQANRRLEALVGIRSRLAARGSNRYSAAYRKHLPHLPEMTKGELRAMLAQAFQNTAALQ